MHEFIRTTLKSVANGNTLTADEAETFMNLLMEGQSSPVQTAGLLAAMSVRGETVAEIVGFAKAMRSHSVHIDVQHDIVDTCGTGGDGGHTFNISTASAFVAAAAGAYVAKHGNRAVSSHSGSADVLQALGAKIDIGHSEATLCLEDTGVSFLFAPQYHPAMKHAAQPRQELGFRTIFNILGPLTNPANPQRQVLGVFRADLVEKVAEALSQLGSKHALVVHGHGGIDELSISGGTLVAEVKDGKVKTFTLQPEDVGLKRAPLSEITGGNAEENAGLIRNIFTDTNGPSRDIVAYNAGAVLYVSGLAQSVREGVEKAQHAIAAGKAMRVMQGFIDATHMYSNVEVAQ
ncbi:anthranilate phosphoribosyltransferase [Alicyclobacillus sp. SO9]|uniref:anthranilate phosphoribosyltransferase n=1 Tax=Alicyclobacillus sp. SO9 TaxID=2665646 RepID=UPI0018E70CC7|nr:anthranilate phosphoribosyltransferase [Alicyclobacillus sp. SO9]QQE76800.1 anthranilate phosphoribosyltransferase [Alicyclobacillus sp. SO9]